MTTSALAIDTVANKTNESTAPTIFLMLIFVSLFINV